MGALCKFFSILLHYRLISFSGRFGTIYDYHSRFASPLLLKAVEERLINAEEDRSEGILACFAVRFALEFRPKTLEERLVERRQVEHHMRICLAVSPDLEYLATVAPSEPLLAEAAIEFTAKSDALYELLKHLDSSGVDRGHHGELAAMLLIMNARDRISSSRRESIVPVVQFLEELFPKSRHRHLKSALPSNNHIGDSSLAEAFEHANMWFNHFIRVEDANALHVNYLAKLIARGAAVVCANDQAEGIDIILPFLLDGTTISESNTSAILIQVNYKKILGGKSRTDVFDDMDPIEHGIFKLSEAKPVIRMVFTLGKSDESGVTFVGSNATDVGATSDIQMRSCTTYDIWCANISKKTFSGITSDDIENYERILQRFPDSTRAYALELKDDFEARGKLKREVIYRRRKLNPGTQADEGFYWYGRKEGVPGPVYKS
jgi:hypothetical protein